MKAITIYQPWAALIAVGAKIYETRNWATNYRGKIAIHAGKKKPSAIMTTEDINIIPAMGCAFGIQERQIIDIVRYLDSLPLGAVIATAELIGCYEVLDDGAAKDNQKLKITRYIQRRNYSREYIQGNELLLGEWTPGRYAWELANVQMLPEPVPARGKQGLWDWRND